MENSMYEEASRELAIVPDAKLKEVSTLAKKQLLLEERIKKGEAYLKELKEEQRKISEVDLPESLANNGLSEIALSDGTRIEISSFYAAHISKEREARAFAWLEENGFGSLIKQKYEVTFDREAKEESLDFEELMDKEGITYDKNPSVHAGTLKKFVKDQLSTPAEDKAIKPPLDLFGIFVGKVAKIIPPKQTI